MNRIISLSLNLILVLTLGLVVGAESYAQIDDRLEQFDREYIVSKSNPQQVPVAIDGFDPVSFFNASPEKGISDISENFGGTVYRFANEENRAEFLTNPEKYEPTYGGYCAWAMRTGGRVPIDTRFFSFDFDDEGNKIRIHFFVAQRAMENFNHRRTTRGLTSVEILEKTLAGDKDAETILETSRGFQSQSDDSWFNILENDL